MYFLIEDFGGWNFNQWIRPAVGYRVSSPEGGED